MAGGALAAGVLPLLNACAGPVRADLSDGDDPAPALDPPLADILHHASLAPSGHNAQPWVVEVPERDRLVIGTARDRWLPQVDPENRELLLSLGCFLENLVVAARHHGFDPEYEVVARTPSDTPVLDVRLRRGTPSADPLDRILLRRTVRSDHLATAVTSADVRALCAPHGDRAVFFPAGTPNADWLAEHTIEANRVQAYRDPAQEELSRWIRWADDDARTQRNGLSPEAMEITGVAGWYVRHFMSQRAVMRPSFRDRGVDAVREQVRRYGGWLVITSPDESIPTLVETGRRFERMWLESRARMIGIHPMTQILEEAPFRDLVGPQLGVSGRIQFLLRVSYLAEYPEPVSLRMPLSRFVHLG